MMFRKSDKKRAGVSLVTVLLFMLVATIAATATYKWITSESHSSASRMRQREAYQSAVAGIENTRAWMTYNANDVGALIKQYRDGKNKPINISDQLKPWLRSGQDFDVWLTGVDAGTAHNFKLKFLSTGRGPDNTEHSEVAIFNVDGLYQVTLPAANGGAHADFEAAYFGSSTNFSRTDSKISSAIVNGDLTGSQVQNTERLIVMGDVTQGSNDHIDLADVTCIGGTITLTNSGITRAGDLYIHGDANTFIAKNHITGDVYFNGNVNYSNSQNIEIEGSVTLNGTITSTGLYGFKIDNDLCLTDNGRISLSPSNQRYFTVEQGVWIPNGKALHGSGKTTMGYMWLGQNAAASNRVYIKGGHPCNNPVNWYDEMISNGVGTGLSLSPIANVSGYSCASNGWYQVSDHIPNSHLCVNPYNASWQSCIKWASDYSSYALFSSKGVNTKDEDFPAEKPDDLACADDVKAYCEEKLGAEREGCDGSHYKMDDILQTAAGTFDSEPFLSACKLDWTKDMNNGNLTKALNNCFDKASAASLYNGYLVVKIKATDYNTKAPNTTGALDGKFIIIIDGPGLDAKLPNTKDDDDYVFLYLPDGASKLAQQSGKFNYFIYALEDIGLFNNEGNVFHGSMYFSAENCAKLVNWGQGGAANMQFYEELKLDLENSHIICPAELPSCGAIDAPVGGGEGEGGGDDIPAGGVDAYFIAASPMLNVTLESQYENNESVNGAGAATLTPSFIVLPRVIRLPKDPYGRIGDYYDIVNLNGSGLLKDASKGVCDNMPAPGDLLYNRSADEPQPLALGLHTCRYREGNSTVQFFVYVNDETVGNTPYVEFDNTYQAMSKNSTAHVTLVYPKGDGGQFVVEVTKPVLPDGSPWSITPEATLNDGTTCENEDESCFFKLFFDASGGPTDLFEVKTTNAEEGTYSFSLKNCEGCLIDSKDTKVFSISSAVTISRGSLQDYCSRFSCSEEISNMADLNSWPDCSPEDNNTAWIKAVSYNTESPSTCSGVANTSWTCGISGDIKLSKVEDGVPQGCEVVIPEENNTLPKAILVSGEPYSLYGALKAKKFTFHVGFDGNDYTGKTITVTSNRWTGDKTCTGSAEGCDYELFTGDNITLNVTDNDFSYWKCDPSTSSANCVGTEPFTGETYEFRKINGVNSVVAWFGQRDKHCFFDEFKTTRECTGEGTEWKYCFNYCSGSGDCRIGNGALTDNAKWLVIGDNALRQKLNYEDGKIWLDNSYNSHKKQSEVAALKVMSTVQAGLYGALVGQFQVPRMGRGDDKTSAQVTKSGFMLRSNDAGTQYLFLNVYANSDDGKLAVNACVGNECSGETLLSKALGGNISVSSTDIVTLTAEIKKNGSKDELHISAVDGYYGNYQTATAVIVLNDISGYGSLTGHTYEYVGFSLADPDFKVYDLGWKSEDYNAECWQTAPTIKCSFKAAYVGGIVPLNEEVTPWVGFSSWFNGKSCAPQFQYKGNDACGGTTDTYSNCGESYTFSTAGAHGADNSMAKAGVGECNGSYLLNSERALAYAGSATCGTFWVGETKPCRRSFEFFSGSQALSSGENAFPLGVGEYATLRDASIKIEMDNSSESELEVYLKSETESGYYGANVVYSKSATTTAKTEASFNVMELANEAGFDPERVFGVIIRNLGSGNVTITKIYSVCDAATNVQCKDVVYEGGAFKARAQVKHADNSVTKYKITGEEAVKTGDTYGDYVVKQTLTKEFSPCPGANCPSPDASDIVSLGTESYNPYASDGKSKKYRFKIEAWDDRGAVEGSGCYTTPDKEMSQLAAECRWRSGSSTMSVQQGKGLPDFQYMLPSCGSGNCGWEVIFSNSAIVSGTGVKTDWTSIPDNTRLNYNTVSDPLSTGTTYTIAFRNASGVTTKFEECDLSFTVTDRPPDVTCEFTDASGSHAAGSSVTLSPTVTGCDNGDCKYKVDDGSYESSISSFNAPSEAGSYAHSVTVQRGSEDPVSCGTYTVKVPLAGGCGANAVSGTVAPGGDITPPTPAITNCNGACRYSVTGPSGSSISNGSGYNYGGGAISTPFTDGASGLDGPVQYTLNVWYGDADGFTEALANGFGKECEFTVTYASGGSGGSVTNEGSINCQFDKTTLNLGESFKITPNYGGSCWNGTLKLGGNSVNNDQCINGTSTVTPESVGTLTYTYAVTNGSAGNASCSANVTVNDVVVTGSVDLAKGQSNVSVPCRKQIHLTGQCNDNSWGPFNLTVQCQGSFNKTVGSASAGEYTDVTYNAGNAYTGMDEYVSTECLPGKTMSCQAYCNW